jgi:drug/metabolite transporter (DMT)-like permease
LQQLGISLALLTALLWGATSLEMRKAMVRLSTISVTALTSAIGVAMGLAASLLDGSGNRYLSLGLDGVVFAAVAGVLVFALGRFLWYLAINEIGASRSNSVVAAEALIAPVASVTVAKEGFGPLTILGSVLVVLGVWLIYRSMGNRGRAEGGRKALGLGASVAAAFVFAFGSAFARLANLSTGSPTVTYTLSSLSALLASTPFLLRSGGFSAAMRNGHAALGGLFNSLASFSYWGALSLAPVPVVVPASQTFPVFTVLLSLTAYKGSERIDSYSVLGALLTTLGVVLVSIP